MRPVPAGKKGKGLRKLPKPVRNKMGFMKGGGLAKATANLKAKGLKRGGAIKRRVKVCNLKMQKCLRCLLKILFLQLKLLPMQR